MLATPLEHNSSRWLLDLRYNRIGLEGATELAKSLGQNRTPLHLRVWIKANELSDRGAAALAAFLEADLQLAHLAEGQKRVWF